MLTERVWPQQLKQLIFADKNQFLIESRRWIPEPFGGPFFRKPTRRVKVRVFKRDNNF